MFLIVVMFFVSMSYKILAIRFKRSSSYFMIVGGVIYLVGAMIGVSVFYYFIRKHQFFSEFSLTFIGIPVGLIFTLVFRSIWRDGLEKTSN